jgi:hypothetical protein
LFAVLFKIYLLVHRQAGKLRPSIAKMQHFAYLIDELRMRIVVSPAPGKMNAAASTIC